MTPSDAGLISDAWHSGRRAQNADDIRRHGFTSYYNVNLVARDDFEFMNKAALEVFAQYLRVVGKEGTGMRLDSAWLSVYGRAHFQHFYPLEISWMPFRYSIQPKKGLFVVFPSYLVHNTDPHDSDEPRVIYSANVQLEFSKLTNADKARPGS